MDRKPALDCQHEQQSPAAGIPWNKEAVLEYYKRTNDWDEATIRRSLLEKYPAPETQFSAFDKESIMVYAFPAELTLDGSSRRPLTPWPELHRRRPRAQCPRAGGRGTGHHNLSGGAPQPLVRHQGLRPGAHLGHLRRRRPEIQVGEFATSEDHAWWEPKQKTSRHVTFKRPFSAGPPRVVVWYKMLDIDSGTWWRTMALAENVTAEGFDLSVETWGDRRGGGDVARALMKRKGYQ
ncbi:hypothetical protein B0T10DRAFT_463375 [Thelonectria olida]|uniref:H-type lectin domain-containing protein n=1 Tax=Thelonectria olida TaxID=1576542 RepID=A0A9P8VWX0_9HYPO|nr:hypothetical protein B0T10DRAFT_463375 [Thelonectria olida]